MPSRLSPTYAPQIADPWEEEGGRGFFFDGPDEDFEFGCERPAGVLVGAPSIEEAGRLHESYIRAFSDLTSRLMQGSLSRTLDALNSYALRLYTQCPNKWGKPEFDFDACSFHVHDRSPVVRMSAEHSRIDRTPAPTLSPPEFERETGIPDASPEVIEFCTTHRITKDVKQLASLVRGGMSNVVGVCCQLETDPDSDHTWAVVDVTVKDPARILAEYDAIVKKWVGTSEAGARDRIKFSFSLA